MWWDFSDLTNVNHVNIFSDLDLFQRCHVADAVVALWWIQFPLVVFDPVCDAEQDPQPVQTAQMPGVRLGDGDQDLFRSGLAQHTRERLQKHLRSQWKRCEMSMIWTSSHRRHLLERRVQGELSVTDQRATRLTHLTQRTGLLKTISGCCDNRLKHVNSSDHKTWVRGGWRPRRQKSSHCTSQLC